MPLILPDNNITGHFAVVRRILEGAYWGSIWTGTGCAVREFEDIGLPRHASDLILWQTCQQHGIVILTGNRNGSGPDSFDVVIRTLGQSTSLPVLTLADPDRILRRRSHAERVAERIVDYLMNIDIHRGAGRLYVP